MSDYNVTLAEAVADFLTSLSLQDREKTQAEIYKFVKWLGLHSKVDELSPVDIANYAEQITPLSIKPVKSFLTYVQKRGLTHQNLATHIRAKKTSSKISASAQGSQAQAALTLQGYAKLEEELANLKSQRSSVIEEIRKAAADKDFRENAPLEAAREQKSHLEGRIEELESTLKLAKVMGESQDTSKITIGDTISLCDLLSGKKLNYTLVDPHEANPTKGKISVASPIGKALLDKETGQTIEIAAPAGAFSYLIEAIQHI